MSSPDADPSEHQDVSNIADKPKKFGTLIFLCVILFLDAMGTAIIIPVMPDLIQELSDLPVNRAAEIGGWILFAFAATQFVSAPILGALSDRYGRRPILLLALLGYGLDYFIMAMAPSLFWLFVARIISGGFGATYPAANAAIVDITAPANRARNFGFAGAAVGLGFIFGPIIGGLAGQYDARLPFLIAGGVTLSAVIYGAFALPETLPLSRRRRFEAARANPFGNLIAMSRHRGVIGVLMAVFFMQLASQSYNSIWAFYTIERFDWTPFAIGLSVGLYGVLLAVVQGGLTGPVIKRIGEVNATLISVAGGVTAYLVLAFAATPFLLYAGILIGSIGGFGFPAMQAIMSKATPEDAQGELQGAVMSSFSLTAIIGPIAMTQLFYRFTNVDDTASAPYLPGAPFILSAVLMVFCLAVFLRSNRTLVPAGNADATL